MLKKILKYTLYVLLFLAAIIFFVFLYLEYQKSLALGFSTTKKWEWEDKSYNPNSDGVQISSGDDMKKSILRRVHMSENYAVYAYKNDDYTVSTFVIFQAKCKPDTVITTTQKFSNGEPKTLRCQSDGVSLVYSVLWGRKPSDTWSENLDGYKVDEAFYRWNFDRLDREITLSKAK